jgi:hypothetical protein
VDRELRGVVIDPDGDPALVARDVVDPVRNGLEERIVDEVVHVHGLGLALRLPFSSAVLELPDELLLLAIDGDHRLSSTLHPQCLVRDVLELGVSIRVIPTFEGLAGRLEAVAHLAQHAADGVVAHREPLVTEGFGELRRALARPAQRRRRITSRRRIDESVECGGELRVCHPRRRPTRAPATNPPLGNGHIGCRILNLGDPCPDASGRHPQQARDDRDATPPQRPCLRRRPPTALRLVQARSHRVIPLQEGRFGVHNDKSSTSILAH